MDWDFDPAPQPDDFFEKQRKEDEIFDSLTRMRAADSFFGVDSGRGFLGDYAADRQLAHDIAEGRDVRDALADQRLMDSLFGQDHSKGIIADVLTDNAIASAYENGRDLGDAIADQRFMDDLFG